MTTFWSVVQIASCSPFAGAESGPAPDGGEGADAADDGSLAVDGKSGRPKVVTLTETFDTVLDPDKWNSHQGKNSIVSITPSGQLSIVDTVSASDWGEIWSVPRYDATESQLMVKIVQPGNAAEADAGAAPIVWMKLVDSTGNFVEIGINKGRLYAKTYVKNVGQLLSSAAYVPTMKWVRLRETGGTTYWEHAAASSGPWQLLELRPDPIPLSAVTPYIGAGFGNVGTVIFDDVNVPDP